MYPKGIKHRCTNYKKVVTDGQEALRLHDGHNRSRYKYVKRINITARTTPEQKYSFPKFSTARFFLPNTTGYIQLTKYSIQKLSSSNSKPSNKNFIYVLAQKLQTPTYIYACINMVEVISSVILAKKFAFGIEIEISYSLGA